MSYDFNRLVDRRHSDSDKWLHYDPDVLPLWVADMDFPSPEPVIRALRERAEHGIFGYGTEPGELRGILVERLERLYGWRVSPDAILFLPGVVAGFNLACHAFAGLREGVLIQTPVYGPIVRAAANSGRLGLEMELTREPNGSYAVDLGRFAEVASRGARVFILCNPHNPVGRVFRRDELEAMAQICLRHDVIICSDEIHCDLLYSGYRHVPIASLSPEVEAQTITLMAPSKTYNVAGLDCAFAVIPNPDLRRKLQMARKGLVGDPSIMGFAAALAAYRDGDTWLGEVLCYLEGNRDYLLDQAPACLPGISVARPEGTYLAWLDCRQAGIPGQPHEFFLRSARVAVNDGAWFGRGGEGFVRLNFACPRPLLVEGLLRMKQALSTLWQTPRH